MIIYDLTHTIHSNMPVYPGTEQPVLQKAYTMETDGFRETKITMYSHTGTHIDAPAHMLSDGVCLDNLEIDHFIGKATVLDFSNNRTKKIELEAIKEFEEKIRNVEFIILNTGWSKYWGENKYFENFPSLTEEAAEWLTQFNLKGIGIDAISIDSVGSSTFAIHKTLLNKNMIIIENLTNLDSLNDEIFILNVMPLKNKDADGSPVRAVAIENM